MKIKVFWVSWFLGFLFLSFFVSSFLTSFLSSCIRSRIHFSFLRFKVSKFQNFGSCEIQIANILNFQNFKVPKAQPFKFPTFQAFKIPKFQSFKLTRCIYSHISNFEINNSRFPNIICPQMFKLFLILFEVIWYFEVHR